MAKSTAGAPWYLWAVGIVGVLWNGMGVVLWGGTTFQPETFLAGSPEAQRVYVASLPVWSSITWGLGVLGGLAGCVLLLLRKGLAVPFFAASLFGAVVNQLVYVTNPPPPGFFNPGLTGFIIAFALLSYWVGRSCKARGVI